MAGRKKILVIDDNKIISDLFVMDFGEDFDVESAGNGPEGLEAAAKTRPDIILLDVNMPGMSGLEVARELDRRAETKNIPVLIITASAFNDAVKKEFQSCSNLKGFLSKLSPASEIRELVRKLLGS